MVRLRMVLLLLTALVATSEAQAEVLETPRHLLVLRDGVDMLTGSYVFALQNTGDKPERFKAPVMLPKETDDFVPQEGAEAADLSLAPGGGVVIDKEVPPGVLVISIGFRVPGRYGHTTLTLTPASDIENLTVLVPKQSAMHVASPLLSVGEAEHAPDPAYQPLVTSAVMKAGATVTVEVDGLPEGRSRIWIVGSVTAGMLILLAGFFAWRTRPKITADAGGSVLVG